MKEQEVEVRDLFLHAGLTGRVNAGVLPPHGAPGLPRSATDGGMDVAIGGDERD